MISKPRFWKKHNELHIVTLKNRDPDILDHLFQKMCGIYLGLCLLLGLLMQQGGMYIFGFL